MYCFITKLYDLYNKERGSGSYIPKIRWTSYYKNIDIKLDTEVRNIEELFRYKRVLFMYQANNYNIKIDLKTLKRMNPIFFTRTFKYKNICSLASNGFSMYRNHSSYNFYIPTITDFICQRKEMNEPIIGLYIRNNSNSQIIPMFIEELNSISFPISVYTMGNNITLQHKNIKKHCHTYDNKEFFENTTHYFYPFVDNFIDPFPNTLLEAMQNNKQIVAPYNIHRNFTDGIDDLLSLVPYHSSLKESLVKTIEYNCPLNHSLMKNYDKRLIENNFEYSFNRNKYKTFKEWIENV